MLITIDTKDDAITVPIHLVDMKLRRGSTNILSAVVNGAAMAGRGVHSALHIILIIAPVLHNVDLATGRPASSAKALSLPVTAILSNVFTQSPDCRPGARARRKLCSNLYTSIFKRELGIESCRRELFGMSLVCKTLLNSNNFQTAIADVGVFNTVGVVLLFVIEPAPAIG